MDNVKLDDEQSEIINRILAQINLNPQINEPARHYIFDGDTFAEYKGIDQTNVWPAMSGFPDKQNIKYQFAPNGPMPSGRYYFNKKNIEFKDDADWYDRYLGWARPWQRYRDSWGDYRIPLKPANWYQMRGRGGIFAHGGKEFTSAGCLDLTDSGMNDFVQKIRSYPQDDYIIDVRYPFGRDFKWQKK